MSACQMPNGGCLHVEEVNACPLCDEDGADRIAEWANRDGDEVPENAGCCGYTYEQCHRGPGCEFNAWRAKQNVS